MAFLEAPSGHDGKEQIVIVAKLAAYPIAVQPTNGAVQVEEIGPAPVCLNISVAPSSSQVGSVRRMSLFLHLPGKSVRLRLSHVTVSSLQLQACSCVS